MGLRFFEKNCQKVSMKFGQFSNSSTSYPIITISIPDAPRSGAFCIFFLTLVCQVLFFLYACTCASVRACASKRKRASVRARHLLHELATCYTRSLPHGLHALSCFRSWPDSCLAPGFALARGSRLRILAWFASGSRYLDKIYWVIIGYSGISYNNPQYFGIFWNIVGYYEIFWNIL